MSENSTGLPLHDDPRFALVREAIARSETHYYADGECAKFARRARKALKQIEVELEGLRTRHFPASDRRFSL